MEDIMEPQTEQPQPKKRGGWPKGRKRGAGHKIAKPPKEANPFEGLSERMCCEACTPKKCVISGDEFCASPVYGMQPRHALIPAVVERRRAARKYLDIQKAGRRADQR